MIVLPLGHTASINYSLLPCAYAGGRLVLSEDFWTVRTSFWSLVEEHRITYVEVVPTVLYALLNLYKQTPNADLSSLKFIGCGSAPLQKGIQDQVCERFGKRVANLYGLSETGPSHVDYPLEPDWEPGSIGFPLDVNCVSVVDEKGRELPSGQVGEIAIKGENVFIGYFQNESLYRQTVREGYFYTGDLGWKDSSGRFFFVERKKDLIIRGGVNIAPGEIDEVLLGHPAIKEAVSVGLEGGLLGERIKSFVVLKDGYFVRTDEILRFCRQNLSSIKVPDEILFVEEIPKTHSGKLLRRLLKEGGIGEGLPHLSQVSASKGEVSS